ncbi:MAG TPA: hypothetical protein VMV69_11850 [Pirellulales bacterium]|nr:hypothetical protein [Pirellulales bacterium]
MTEFQRLFLVQSRSDFAVFKLLRKDQELPPCHALHYLQMATELLGKAHAWRQGPRTRTHRAFVGFLRSLTSNRQAQVKLGFEGRNEHWGSMIRKSVPLAERVETLAPALNPDGPNSEYPWPRATPQFAPVEHAFDVWRELQKPAGGTFLNLVGHLFAAAEAFL